MRKTLMNKWLVFVATGGILLQGAAGCNTSEFQTLLASSVEGFVTSVLGLFVDAGVSSLLGT